MSEEPSWLELGTLNNRQVKEVLVNKLVHGSSVQLFCYIFFLKDIDPLSSPLVRSMHVQNDYSKRNLYELAHYYRSDKQHPARSINFLLW